MDIALDKIYRIDIDYNQLYKIDETKKNVNKKVLLNTSTRVFDGKKYDTLYIIEPRVAYLIPLPEMLHNYPLHLWNLLGEFGIVMQVLSKYILLYNTNENHIYLNKNCIVAQVAVQQLMEIKE